MQLNGCKTLLACYTQASGYHKAAKKRKRFGYVGHLMSV